MTNENAKTFGQNEGSNIIHTVTTSIKQYEKRAKRFDGTVVSEIVEVTECVPTCGAGTNNYGTRYASTCRVVKAEAATCSRCLKQEN